MRVAITVAVALLLTSCGVPQDEVDAPPSANVAGPSSTPATSASPSAHDTVTGMGDHWSLRSSKAGAELALVRADKSVNIRLFCPAGDNRIIVNVPAFRPIGSEERLSFGGGGVVVALVADTRGDEQRGGGVSGSGEVADNLEVLLGGRLTASYGVQNSGPHQAPPRHLSRNFITACGKSSVTSAITRLPPSASSSACVVLEGKGLDVMPRRAVGTEPFWAASIVGRCVTYSRLEDQNGRRVWTRYTKGPDGERWSGALDKLPFELRIRDAQGCSDGMSDKQYPFAVELMVRGELRKGCAEPTSLT